MFPNNGAGARANGYPVGLILGQQHAATGHWFGIEREIDSVEHPERLVGGIEHDDLTQIKQHHQRAIAKLWRLGQTGALGLNGGIGPFQPCIARMATRLGSAQPRLAGGIVVRHTIQIFQHSATEHIGGRVEFFN